MTPPRISLRDEADLTWFFMVGQAKFQRSVHGAMVEQLERGSMGAHRCPVCSGVGVLEDMVAVSRHRARWRPRRGENTRTVWVFRKSGVWLDMAKARDRSIVELLAEQGEICEQPIEQVVGAECQICRGTGWVPAKRCEPRCTCWGQGRLKRAGCRECLGTGTPQVSARPVCNSHDEGGVEPDSDVLTRFAVVSRRLQSVSPRDRRTLERYYGPHGQSWADQPGGRLLGLVEFTRAGRALLRRTRVKGDERIEASPAERIFAQRVIQKRDPQTWRAEFLERADEEARHALHEAHRAWLAVGGNRGWEGEANALLEAIDATGEAYEAWMASKPDMWEVSE